MGLGGISIWQLLILLLIVFLLFGSGKLRSLGGDLGGAIKGFKKAIKDEEDSGTEMRKDSDDKAGKEQDKRNQDAP